ncbi:winged helix-turn-helix transcriptional regulator [Antrihabitans cavernicola]|uniref:Helix-turn-helix transcriptional regulator n=1 Tax=Antrihabitans cavernicola TaxID=2495913 RepID=A0A5A7S3Q5_9NOCA|nr:helix-turn-helix domain-containing protein [Spelaeibacter cavernicola]KAA0018459.1 helix-turn-helix transcriptional regulator [Spelaeibacter cavernicola]
METKAPEGYDVFARSCPSRGVFDRIGERWTGLVLLALQQGTMRFSELRRRIDGISQKMLTQTLRSLERDGLVAREVFPTVPVTVEYTLTPLGASLCDAVAVLRTWAYEHIDELETARAKFEDASA